MDQKSTYNILNEKLKGIPRAQIRSISLAVLPRLMGAIHQNKENCPDCKKFNQQGEYFVDNIKDLFTDNVATVRQFENWVELSQNHLKLDHQLRVKGKLTATYTAIAMVAGIFIAALYVWFSGGDNYIGYISLGWLAGMLGGYLAGKLHEARLNKHHKLY